MMMMYVVREEMIRLTEAKETTDSLVEASCVRVVMDLGSIH